MSPSASLNREMRDFFAEIKTLFSDALLVVERAEQMLDSYDSILGEEDDDVRRESGEHGAGPGAAAARPQG